MGNNSYDRVIQISSLVQITLDPFYRTINGLIVLIEKEWISMGHPFSRRNQNQIFHINKTKLNNENKDQSILDETSPIFIQFLDCLFQFLNQFPSSFEYNKDLLIYLAEESQSNRYSTFLYDSEYENTVCA